jgi:hypothetical protein
MPGLEEIRGPEDLRALSPNAARELVPQIRRLLVDTCTANGGHLGPNLGVVELSIALHRVFGGQPGRNRRRGGPACSTKITNCRAWSGRRQGQITPSTTRQMHPAAASVAGTASRKWTSGRR